MRKISPQPGFDARTVQPVASRYTDCAIPAPEINRYMNKLNFLAILKCLFLIWTQEASCYSCERIELHLYLYGLTYTIDIQFIHFPLERPFIECCVGKLIGICCENQTGHTSMLSGHNTEIGLLNTRHIQQPLGFNP